MRFPLRNAEPPTPASESDGGEGGIRTLGDLRHTRFPSVRLRPLGHLSEWRPVAGLSIRLKDRFCHQFGGCQPVRRAPDGWLAEREGFEPSEAFRPHWFSKPARSASSGTSPTGRQMIALPTGCGKPDQQIPLDFAGCGELTSLIVARWPLLDAGPQLL
jgi:hypothetical protein